MPDPDRRTARVAHRSNAAVAALAPATALASEGGGHGIDWLELGFLWINVLLLVGGLYYLLRRRVADAFRQRHAEVLNLLEEAKRITRDAEERKADFERRIVELEAGRETELERYRAEADAERERILEAARRHADKLLADAERGIEQRVRAAEQRIRAEIAHEIVAETRARLGTSLSAEDRARLLDDALSRLGGVQ